MADDEFFMLIDDDESIEPIDDSKSQEGKWFMLVVDDEPSVHEVTHMVLSDFEFDGKSLEIIDAYSAEEAMQIFRSNNQISVALIDVVMESEDAGLRLAKYVREELNNSYTRLVLRTGQPGKVPEEAIIREYDINDYKEKTDLTKTKLKTLLFSTLRSYRDICVITESVDNLSRVIDAVNCVAESSKLKLFARAILEQIITLLKLEKEAVFIADVSTYTAPQIEENRKLVTATGKYLRESNGVEVVVLPDDVERAIKKANKTRTSCDYKNYFVGYYRTGRGSDSILVVNHERPISKLEKRFFEIYSISVAITYESLLLREEMEDTERELIYMLGEAVECLDDAIHGSHVKRVGLMSGLLAELLELDQTTCVSIKASAPLHDIGKKAVPESILNKTDALDANEWEAAKSHAVIGAKILGRTDKSIFRMSSIIASQHHEKWDGTGYPEGLKGEEIHLAARIVGLVDVFDVLTSSRPHKKAWTFEEAENYIRTQSGKHFDPVLVTTFLSNIEKFMAIKSQYPDKIAPA